MTVPTASPRRVDVVRCPVCLDRFTWPSGDVVWVRDEQLNYRRLNLAGVDELKRAAIRQDGYVQCPNPSKDAPDEHFLPATYNSFAEPLVVGLVGTPASGKTHLLTAMIREAVEHRALARYGLTVSALDERRHAAFRRSHIEPLERGRQLDGTAQGVTMFADILLVKGSRTTRPVTFFDVAGEDLQTVGAAGWNARFLAGAGALMFVHGLADHTGGPRAHDQAANRAFSLVLTRLSGMLSHLAQLPAVIVATKADRQRYLAPVDRWWQDQPSPDQLAARMLNESRDVYALLHRQGAEAALEPFEVFDRCTLHLVSASGCDADPDTATFPREFAPRRVLQPLLALLAMSGVLDAPDAHEVGR